MGIDQWRDEPDWPLPDTEYVSYYLHGSGRANTAAGDGRARHRHPGRGGRGHLPLRPAAGRSLPWAGG